MTKRLAVVAALCLASACDLFDPLNQGRLRVEVEPRDTALYVGASFYPRALMVNYYQDRYPSEHLVYRALDAAIRVDGDGRITGLAFGRARYVVEREHLVDTGWVSVVPAGVLAVSSDSAVYVVNTDGSGLIVVAPSGFGSGSPAWLPGDSLVFHYVIPGGAGESALFATNFAGDTTRLTSSGARPRGARDGAWIYFQGGNTVRRVRRDGTGEEVVTSATSRDGDPAPDGTELAFGRSVLPGPTWGIAIRDLGTGSESTVTGDGLLPRWNPAGDSLAYWSGFVRGSLFLVSTDGTGKRRIAESNNYDGSVLDWSPDGQWLVARSFDATLELIHVATGLSLPLGFAASFRTASWRW